MSNFVEHLRESKVQWTIDRFNSEEDYKARRSYETSKFDGNVMLNAGITALLQLLAGTASPNQYSNANAKIGVGDDGTTPENPVQTGLQAITNKVYADMVVGYPTVVGQTVTFKASFGTGDANFAWQEFVVTNNAGIGITALNRKVEYQSIKIAGQVWEITLAITLS